MWPYSRILVYVEIQGKCINWCLRTCHLTSSCVSHVAVTGKKLKEGISDSVKFYKFFIVSCEENVRYFKFRVTEGWLGSKSVTPGCFTGKSKRADMSFLREVTEYKTAGCKPYYMLQN